MRKDLNTTNQLSPSEKLYDAISEIDDALVENAADYTFSKSNILRKGKFRHFGLATAACICLIIGTIFICSLGAGDGGSGNAFGSSYMSYAGPVFSLTSTSDVTGINVSRHTDWDFSPYESEYITEEVHPDIPENTETFTYDRYQTESIVTDSYILTNTTNNDITLSLLYPFAGTFSDPIRTLPQITVDSTSVNVGYFAGKYSGSYGPAWGDDESDEELNLDNIGDWQGYKALLSDGIYLTDAMGDFPSLDIPIIVYEYSNLTYVGDEEASNPTFAIKFKHDSTKTTITGWGWNAGGWEDDGTGYYACSRVYVPSESEFDKGATAYFIIIGEDIETPTIEGYINAGCDDGNEVEGVSADYQKYETTLEQFLVNVCLVDYAKDAEFMMGFDYSDDAYIQSLLTQEMILGYIAQLMYDDGILSGDGIERYDVGWLENYVFDFSNMQRVMYVTFDVTIPANSNISVDATMTKDASIDYTGKNLNRNGYDMVTTLASPFIFTKQTASISNYDSIEILDTNFGFDIEMGITEVELDLNQEHYWMDIKKKVSEE